MRRRRCQSRGGFTLIEIMIVLAIILVIAAMAVPRLIGRQKAAAIKEAQIAIANVEKAADLWAVDHQGTSPSSIEVLLQPGEDKSAAILEKLPRDAWQNPLNYEYPSTKAQMDGPAIWSNGPNRQNENGSGDDINNWHDLAKQ